MRLHYMGKYDLNPASLPRAERKPGAVRFREPEDMKRLALLGNALCLALTALFGALALWRCWAFLPDRLLPLWLGCLASLLTLLPHELLHAVCFRGDVYLYTNFAQGMVFVVGTESMSRARFVLLSLLPNLVFGLAPYLLGMLFPRLVFCLALGAICLGMGAVDYYNAFNALTQMPRGARTYLDQFHSYWYMPEDEE